VTSNPRRNQGSALHYFSNEPMRVAGMQDGQIFRGNQVAVVNVNSTTQMFENEDNGLGSSQVLQRRDRYEGNAISLNLEFSTTQNSQELNRLNFGLQESSSTSNARGRPPLAASRYGDLDPEDVLRLSTSIA
jgi:hypothetical protein